MKAMTICLYGAASDDIADSYKNAAFLLGQAMAKAGDKMVFGGGATGIMGACSRGVHEEGGHITGIVPHFMSKFELLNPDCGEIVWVDTMEERKHIMEDMADAFIIGPGGIGTLDEFFQILTLRALERSQKPIVLFNVDGYFDDLLGFLRQGVSQNFIRFELEKLLCVTADPETALRYIHSFN